MAKVIVERPRFGSRAPTRRKGYKRAQARVGWDEQPAREGMMVRGGRGKSFNEHLGPLRRYLMSQVGKAWDKVFADVCRYLDRGSVVQDHVRDHLDDYVATRVMVLNGELCHADGYSVGRPLRSLFYVCPRTGGLRKNKRRLSFSYRARSQKLPVRFLDDREALVRKDRVWHVITFRKFPSHVWVQGVGYIPAIQSQSWQRRDALHEHPLSPDEAERIYGRRIYATAARRASKREVWRMVNSYPKTNVAR